jgi:AcrR family transcriptional regulator
VAKIVTETSPGSARIRPATALKRTEILKAAIETFGAKGSTNGTLADQHIPGGPELFLHLVRTAYSNAQRPGIVQVYTVLSSESVTDDHPGRHYFEDRYLVLRREIRDAFEQLCAQEGVTDRDTIDTASASILAVMDGLQLQWLLDPSAVDLGEATEFAIRALVNSVLRPGPPLESYAR